MPKVPSERLRPSVAQVSFASFLVGVTVQVLPPTHSVFASSISELEEMVQYVPGIKTPTISLKPQSIVCRLCMIPRKKMAGLHFVQCNLVQCMSSKYGYKHTTWGEK